MTVISGFDVHPLCYKTPISGSYLVCLVSMVICGYLLWKQVNLMNNIVSEGDGVSGVCFGLGEGGGGVINYSYDVKPKSCHTLARWEWRRQYG